MARDQSTSRSEDGRTAIPVEQTERGGRDRLGSAAVLTLIGALLAAVISGTSLTFELFPSLKPDPKAQVGADLAVLQLDKNVDYSDYKGRVGRHIDADVRPDHPGNIFYLRAHLEGFKRESVRLKWFLYEENGQRRFGSQREAGEQSIFEPDAPINTQVVQIWVREPGRFVSGFWDADAGDDYFVRFELYSEDVLLAFKDSPKFDIRG
jgi:hypothetical protein